MSRRKKTSLSRSRVELRLTPGELEEWRVLSKKYNRPLSDIIREAVSCWKHLAKDSCNPGWVQLDRWSDV
jgi:hypothetical protein